MLNQDTTGKKFLRETDARILIDRKLREAGWDPEDKNQVITEENSPTRRPYFIFVP